MIAKATTYSRSFLVLFMIGFVKLQLFVLTLYAFGLLRVEESGFFIVVSAQALLAAGFAMYDSALLNASEKSSAQSQQQVATDTPRYRAYFASGLFCFALLWTLLLLGELYSVEKFGGSRIPGSNWVTVLLIAVLSFGTVAMLYLARAGHARRRGNRQNNQL